MFNVVKLSCCNVCSEKMFVKIFIQREAYCILYEIPAIKQTLQKCCLLILRPNLCRGGLHSLNY